MEKKASGNGPIFAALAANVGVFAVKAVAAALSNSSAMFSEAVHSLSDTANEAVLLIGKKRAEKRSAEYEFGAYRIRYLASFTVAILLFFVGGVFSVYQSVTKIQHVIAHDVEVETHLALIISAVVLVLCAIMEGLALRNSIKQARANMQERGQKHSLWQYWKTTKASELAAVMAEDTLALIGLFFAFIGLIATLITGNPIFDSLGGACVGMVLVIGAGLLAKKTGSLLVGEALTDEEDARITAAVESVEKVARIINMQTMALSEDRVLICLKIEIADDSHTDNAIVTNAAEKKIREALPWYKCEVYIESDRYRADYQPQVQP